MTIEQSIVFRFAVRKAWITWDQRHMLWEMFPVVVDKDMPENTFRLVNRPKWSPR